MTITFKGPKIDVKRVETGFWSFDNACSNNRGERGFAIPAFAEVYAKPGIGKTAFVTTIAGIIAKRLGNKSVNFLDWELQDFDTIIHILENQGFTGTLERILEEKDEDSIDKFYKLMKSEDSVVGIMDSIAAFVSTPEEQGKQTDAVMGKRAFNMARFSRKTIRNLQLRETPAAVLCTNHLYPTLGAMVAGTDTAGGEGKKFMSTYRILLKKFFWKAKKKTVKFDEGWVVEGVLDKNRMGYTGQHFYMAMIMGEGMHQGLTAVFDCLIHDYADLDRVVKMDGKTYGTLSAIVQNRDDEELFQDFYNKLRSIAKVSAPDEEDEYELEQVDDDIESSDD